MLDVWSILLVALAGGLLPLGFGWSERHLHTALALATGIFLGAVFLHFLPALSAMSLEASETAPAGGAAPHAHGGDRWLWLCVLIGVLAVYLTEALVLRTHDHDERHRHRAVGCAALLGLTVHALTEGIGLAAARADEVGSRAMLLAILAHKGFESFSLTTVFQLAGARRRTILYLVAAFAAVTPLGLWVGEHLTARLGGAGLAILTALAAGTFLYVCLCELLVEVFHHREDSVRRVLLLAAGIALMVAFAGVEQG